MPTSPGFMLALSVVFLVYWAIPARFRSCLLSVAGTAYCIWLDPGIGATLIFVSCSAFLGGRLLGSYRSNCRVLRPVFVLLLVSPFLFWRYQEDVLLFCNQLGLWHGSSRSVAAGVFGPIGVSFFTFRAISYVLEVGRGSLGSRSFLDVASYVTFFPQLLAGPIQKPREFLGSIDAGPEFSEEAASEGVGLILSGLVKKVVAADALAGFVAVKYANVPGATGGELLVASYMFALQLYLDFSGYSEIAVGIGRLLGFGRIENFRKPYFSRSPGEFWVRWHTSLMDWFRDYIYIPLGGNRCGSFRRVINLLAVFAVSGLWHGRGVNFFVWGLANGLMVVAFSGMMKSRAERDGVPGGDSVLPRLIDFVRIVALFHMILLTWVLFRADDLNAAFCVYAKIFRIGAFREAVTSIPVVSLVPALLVIAYEWALRRRFHIFDIGGPVSFARWICYVLVSLAILCFGNFSHVPFIYFKF